ncbi:unnamed protein product [Albugo candida]|uniref:Uncharacterized protein n=1 Tax=Albugo candida TaxID=65357 RepID=A0A024GVP6_9STRA|nr:unnamed protein product [Albugo candida]|eukprot:CCI50752.1 unnamed protein product [Albugo candida]
MDSSLEEFLVTVNLLQEQSQNQLMLNQKLETQQQELMTAYDLANQRAKKISCLALGVQ